MAETKQKVTKKAEEVKPLVVKEHEAKPPTKIETPYPKEEKKKKSDVDFIGEELVKLSNRLNEAELTISDLHVKLKQARVRLGLE